MKFRHSLDPAEPCGLCEAVGRVVEMHRPGDQQMEALTRIVGLLAERLPPWEQRALAESLELIVTSG